jgi:RNA polymerase sigma-70 factor (ECF subfamily)
VTDKVSDIERIITGCLKNDRLSQRQLYDLYAPEMFGVCRRYANSEEEAEDILMEGFMYVFKNLGSYSHKGSFKAWVRAVMLNSAISHFRNSRRFRLEVLPDDTESMEYFEDEKQITTNLLTEQLLELMQRMPKVMGVVFNLKVVDEYSFTEIAQMLGKNENAVRNSYMRARKWLMEELKDEKD